MEQSWASGHRVDCLPEHDARGTGEGCRDPEVAPYYPKWGSKLADVPEADRDEYLFQLAGRWADDIRQSKDDRPTWHYINIPVDRIKPDVPMPEIPDVEGIIRALHTNQEGLKGADKAIALTWMFHLVEDLHQPLHTVKLIDEITPEGDKGGNLFFVRFPPDGKTINLHQVWDGLLTSSDRFSLCREMAIEIVAKEKPDAGGTFEDWAAESYQLAKASAYRNLPHSGDKNNGTMLPEGYGKEARAIGERRCHQVGLRLAKILSDL